MVVECGYDDRLACCACVELKGGREDVGDVHGTTTHVALLGLETRVAKLVASYGNAPSALPSRP